MVRERGLWSRGYNPRSRKLMYLPKDYQQKHSIISGSYSQNGVCDWNNTNNGSFAPSDEANKIGRRFPPRYSPPTTKGGEWRLPLRKLRQKRRVGTTIAHLCTPYCTEVTSLCAPLAIEGHTDGDGEAKPAPVAVKIEGAGGGAGRNHHGTRPTGRSCRRRLLQIWAPVVVQDHAMWLPGGGPQLRVLSVSGAVRQRRAPDPEGQTAYDAGETGNGAGRRRGKRRRGRGRGATSRRKQGRRETRRRPQPPRRKQRSRETRGQQNTPRVQ